jgi:hypothetical protein
VMSNACCVHSLLSKYVVGLLKCQYKLNVATVVSVPWP